MIKHVVALSGGKDSSAMALRLRELNPHIPYQYVITPTGDELPEMQDHWANLEQRLGSKMTVINNGETLFDIIDAANMIPNWRARFCTRILKIDPFIDYMETLPDNSVMYVGLRADEPGRLGLIDPEAKFKIENPLQTWCWGLEEVNQYLKDKGIVIPKRTDCGACFYQRLTEWRDLLNNHPDRYQKYVDIEKKYGHTFRSPQRDTWPADLDGLRTAIQSGRKMTNRKASVKKCRFCSM